MAAEHDHSLITLQQRVQELESLVETISRGKMMWQATFDAIKDPVMIIDSEYNITRANRNMAKAAQMDVRHVIGQKCYEVFAGRTEPCVRCPVNLTRQTQNQKSVELDPFGNGQQYSVNAYSMSLNNSAETVLHYLDITQAKEMQKLLLQSEKMAAVGTLAGGIAHEINNPLGGILAFAQLAMRQLEADHPCQADLKEIEDAALRCKQIVRNLLDFSRKNLNDEHELIHINDVVKKTMSLIEISTKSSNVRLVLHLAENLPPISGHLQKLQQVLLNLITNAAHAMKANGGDLIIKSFANPAQTKVFLQVEDSGQGIAPENLGKIFDPYFTTKQQGEGTGLGLSISYNIMKEHKAKMSVESQKDVGTLFTLEFDV